MKKFIPFLLLLPSLLQAEPLKFIFNPHTGTLDAITRIDSNTVQAGPSCTSTSLSTGAVIINCTGGSTTPGGGNYNVQFDSAGVFTGATFLNVFSTSMTVTGAGGQSVTYNISVGSMTINGSGAGAVQYAEGLDSTVFASSPTMDNFWASSSSHAFVANFNGNSSTYTFVVSSVTPVAGQCAYWTPSGPNSWTVGSIACGSGGGGTPAGNSYDVQVDSNGAFGGSDNFQNNGTQISVNPADTTTFVNESTVTYSGFNSWEWAGTNITMDAASPLTCSDSTTLTSPVGVIDPSGGSGNGTIAILEQVAGTYKPSYQFQGPTGGLIAYMGYSNSGTKGLTFGGGDDGVANPPIYFDLGFGGGGATKNAHFNFGVISSSWSGGGLATCGSATQALGFTSTNTFACQYVPGAGGGASFSLVVTTGGPTSYIGPPISSFSTTTTLLFDSNTTQGSLLASNTYFFQLQPSSVTLQGPLPTKLGTVSVGTWQGSVIDDTYLSPDIQFFDASQPFTATQVFAGSVTFQGLVGINSSINTDLTVTGASTTLDGLVGIPGSINSLLTITGASTTIDGLIGIPGSINTDLTVTGASTTLDGLVGIPGSVNTQLTVGSSVTVQGALAVSSNTILPGTTFYQNGNVIEGYIGSSVVVPAFISYTTNVSSQAFVIMSTNALPVFSVKNSSVSAGDYLLSISSTAGDAVNNLFHFDTFGNFYSSGSMHAQGDVTAVGQGVFTSSVSVSSNTLLPDATFYQNAPVVASSITYINGVVSAPLGLSAARQIVTQSPVNTQTFSSNGTWVKPTWAQFVKVVLVGGGGGGGGGKGATAAAIEGGGGGGGGGAWCVFQYLASDLTATAVVTISTGAGTAAGGNAGNGAAGNTASPTKFAGSTISTFTCYGGGGGIAGQASNGTGGSGGGTAGPGLTGATSAINGGNPAQTSNEIGMGGGGAGATTGAAGLGAEWGGASGGGEAGTAGGAGLAGGSAQYGAGGGGGGGSCQAASQFAGAAGGASNSFTAGGGGSAGGAGSNAGSTPSPGSSAIAGGGGGGGGCSITVVGGAGATGAVPGGGGGGGGSGVNASGVGGGGGGAGAAGEAWVYSW